MMLLRLISRAYDYFASHKNTINGWLSNLFGEIDAGEAIDTYSIRSIPALYRATQIISETIAGLPLNEYVDKGGGNLEIAQRRKTVVTLTDTPNKYQTAYNFWETFVLNLLYEGNAIAVMQMDPSTGEITSIENRCWEDIERIYIDGEHLRYKFHGQELPVPGHRVLHVAGSSLRGPIGTPLHERFRKTFEIEQSSTSYIRNFYKSGANIRGVIETERTMSETGIRALQQSFGKYHNGPDSVKHTPILDGGAKFKMINASMMESGVGPVKKMIIEEISRMTGVPITMLENLDAASYNNIEHLAIQFQRQTIAPYVRRIEAELNRKLAYGSRRWKFDLSGLLYGDMETQADYLKSLFNTSILNPNEIRARLNLSKVEHGDRYFIQGNNMIPVDQIDKFLEKGGATAAGAGGVDSPTILEKDVKKVIKKSQRDSEE